MSSKRVKYLIIVAVCIFISSVIYMAFTFDEVGGADEKIAGVVEEYAKAAGLLALKVNKKLFLLRGFPAISVSS